MKITPAFIVEDLSDDEKNKLKLLGATYSSYSKAWFITSEQKDKLDKNDIPIPVKSSIVIEDHISEWAIIGNTYDKKEMIKSLGGRWNPSTKSWVIPKNKADYETILANL